MPGTKPRKEKAEPATKSGTAGRPIWKGSIAFGLVNVPITLYTLEKKNELSFKLLDKNTKSGIRYERVSEETGQKVEWENIVKGYEYTEGNFVVLEDEDFEKVAVESTQTIEISDFVLKSEIDDMYFEKPYIVLPAKKAEKGYVLLREVLEKTGKVGIGKVVIRTREYLAAVVPKGNALLVNLLRFPHELRNVDDFRLPEGDLEEYNVNSREVQLAEQLVKAMTSKWKPQQYKDEYRTALLEYIEEKAQKGDMAAIEKPEEDQRVKTTNVIDLAELLRESMKKSGATAEEPKEKAPSKKKAG